MTMSPGTAAWPALVAVRGLLASGLPGSIDRNDGLQMNISLECSTGLPVARTIAEIDGLI